MRLLKRLLASLVISTFSGCAAYSVINNDRYYSEDNDVPEMHYSSVGEWRIGYQEQPVADQPKLGNCYNLKLKILNNAILLQG